MKINVIEQQIKTLVLSSYPGKKGPEYMKNRCKNLVNSAHEYQFSGFVPGVCP